MSTETCVPTKYNVPRISKFSYWNQAYSILSDTHLCHGHLQSTVSLLPALSNRHLYISMLVILGLDPQITFSYKHLMEKSLMSHTQNVKLIDYFICFGYISKHPIEINPAKYPWLSPQDRWLFLSGNSCSQTTPKTKCPTLS